MSYIFIANCRSVDDPGVYVLNDGSESVNNFLNAKAANEAAIDTYDSYEYGSRPTTQSEVNEHCDKISQLRRACKISRLLLKESIRVIMNELGEEMEEDYDSDPE